MRGAPDADAPTRVCAQAPALWPERARRNLLQAQVAQHLQEAVRLLAGARLGAEAVCPNAPALPATLPSTTKLYMTCISQPCHHAEQSTVWAHTRIYSRGKLANDIAEHVLSKAGVRAARSECSCPLARLVTQVCCMLGPGILGRRPASLRGDREAVFPPPPDGPAHTRRCAPNQKTSTVRRAASHRAACTANSRRTQSKNMSKNPWVGTSNYLFATAPRRIASKP